jgi:sortase (surface protein transpeptidase)
LTLLAVGIGAGLLAATTVYLLNPSAPAATGKNWTARSIPGPPPLAAATIAKHIQPVTLTIPAIDVTTSLVDLGLNPDGTLRPPTDYQRAGWFAAGPAPGDAGGPPAVIAGHVDSRSGPAIFAHLHELTPGSDIQVTGIDGVARHFSVYRMVDYPKASFPAREVYASTDRAELRLITCTGDFDRRSGSYLNNLVVSATLVS